MHIQPVFFAVVWPKICGNNYCQKRRSITKDCIITKAKLLNKVLKLEVEVTI